MGTPDFAVEPLKALLESNKNIVAVITMPDKPAGRGKKLQSSPVKNFAIDHQLPILQPTNLKDPDFIEELKSFNADLQIVVAFRMLPEIVWSMPKLGTFNLHASLLPQYRGAAPINWAVMNGDKETGVTSFFLQHEIDTGDIILQEKIKIEETDNAGDVHDKLMLLGAKTVVKTVDCIENNTADSQAQNKIIEEAEIELKPAPKIFKPDCKLDFSELAERVHNKVRGLSPYPAAFSTLQLNNNKEVTLKIFKTTFEKASHKKEFGEIVSDGKNYLKTACKDGFINVLELQLAGKKRMDIKQFLQGFPVENIIKMY